MKTFRSYFLENTNQFNLSKIDGETGPGYNLTQAVEDTVKEEAVISNKESGIGSYEFGGAKGYDASSYETVNIPRNYFVIDITDSLTKQGKSVFDTKNEAYWESFFRRNSGQGTTRDWEGMNEKDATEEWDEIFEDSFNAEPGVKTLDVIDNIKIPGKDGQPIETYKIEVVFLKKHGNKLLAGVHVSDT